MGRRVLIIIENLPAPFERRVWEQAKALRKAGYVVSVISPKGKGFNKWHEVIDGIHIYRHPLPIEAANIPAYLFEYPWAVAWQFILAVWIYFFGPGFSVIHGCDPPDLVFLVACPFKLLGVKYIFDHRDLSPELYVVKFGKKGIWHRLLLLVERLSYKTADVVIATNESYRKIGIERGGFDPGKIFIVRSGPRAGFGEGARPRHDLYPERKLVGYVGVIGPQEGLDMLVDAADHLVNRLGRKEAMFIIMGEGPALKDVKAYAQKKGLLDKYMKFTGYVPTEELISTLASCYLCVNPDHVNPFSDRSTMTKVMEYMALGKPIVMFETTEGRFSAQDSALYAKPNDPADMAEKIAYLFDHPDEAREMGKRGKERFEKYLKWEASVPSLLAAYKKIFEI
ncbi:MAG: glycosyltransferase family 4 protein [candidate division WOR-3 bacterium]